MTAKPKAYCLFEKSGVFKDALNRHGYDAYDFDIIKTEHVDDTRDLFEEIRAFPDPTGGRRLIFSWK